MSDQAVEAIELPRDDDAAFSALMDALAPDPAGDAGAPAQGAAAAEAGTGAPEVSAAAGADEGAGADSGAAGAGDGQAAAGAAEVPGGPAAAAAADPAGAAGTEQPAAQADAGDGAAAGSDQPAGTGDASAAGATADRGAPAVQPEAIAELSTKLEERVTQTYQSAALEEVQREHSGYFDALEKHPMEMVGQTVPAIGREGQVTLNSAAEAREWQDAVKHVLAREVRTRAEKAMDENKDYLDTVHASIELFQKNADLVPGSKAFDAELANRLVALVEPYEVRVEGNLHGYTIPVQPIVDQLRAQIVRERAAAASTAAAPAAGGASSATPPAAGAPPAKQPDPPQAGIPSKAGGSGEGKEDFSTLFGTIGLPDLVI